MWGAQSGIVLATSNSYNAETQAEAGARCCRVTSVPEILISSEELYIIDAVTSESDKSLTHVLMFVSVVRTCRVFAWCQYD